MLLYGDSISEAFRGESLGAPHSAYAGNHAAWRSLMARRRAAAFAIAGDQTMHLLWRVQNGEGPRGLGPQAVFLLIGTNDVAHQGSIHPVRPRHPPPPATAPLTHTRARTSALASLARPAPPAPRRRRPSAPLPLTAPTPTRAQDESDKAGHIVALAVQQVARELHSQAPKAELYVMALPPLQPRCVRSSVRACVRACVRARVLEGGGGGGAGVGLAPPPPRGRHAFPRPPTRPHTHAPAPAPTRRPPPPTATPPASAMQVFGSGPADVSSHRRCHERRAARVGGAAALEHAGALCG